jgi:hypothetical protein
MDREIQRAWDRMNEVGQIIGISGGHSWSIEFLRTWANIQFIDPERVMEILSRAARAYFKPDRSAIGQEEDAQHRAWRQPRKYEEWSHGAREQLESVGGIASLLGELRAWLADAHTDTERMPIAEALHLLAPANAAGMMNYQLPLAELVWANAGILADSAKVVFGDRLGHPKFKIGLSAARAILILRELTRTPGRWEEFWSQITGTDMPPLHPHY